MPILGGILLRALGKIFSAVWLPVIAVAMGWLIEQGDGGDFMGDFRDWFRGASGGFGVDGFGELAGGAGLDAVCELQRVRRFSFCR